MGELEWRQVLLSSAGDDILGAVLYSFFHELKSIEERASGQHRLGRRPSRDPIPLDALLRYVLPPGISLEPLPAALRELLLRKDVTVGQFAQRVPMHRTSLQNLLSGRFDASLNTLERLAHAGGVRPWYFTEWRAHYFSDALHKALTDSPELGVHLVKVANLAERAHTHRARLGLQ